MSILRKTIISFVLITALVLSPVCSGMQRVCACVVFYADTSKVTLKKKETKVINVTLKRHNGYVTYKTSNNNIKCKWAKTWKNNTIKLKVTGKKKGTTTITITNSVDKQKIKIKARVEGTEFITFELESDEDGEDDVIVTGIEYE